MRVIRGIPHSNPFEAGSVATIGNFDGVHLGHQLIINNLSTQGQKLGLPTVVVLFEPHPLEYFKAAEAPSRLTRLREKIAHLKTLPVDLVVLLRFNERLANLEPDEFVRKYLVKGLAVRLLVVGDDFRFGKQRRGTFELLQTLGIKHGFTVNDTTTLLNDGQRISSTAIRKVLAAGDLDQAKLLLGRSYAVCGRVIRGDGRGRQLGFPTANIQLFRKKSPVRGVFAVIAMGILEQPVFGVANVGIRPTVGGDQQVLLEVHLFDFDEDLYGKQVEIIFQQRIREERKFASFQQLTEQIAKDAQRARQLLAV
ncbi:MAG: bifunctional riboflavin kinase/FAD synthetase [Methylococcales bacterium]